MSPAKLILSLLAAAVMMIAAPAFAQDAATPAAEQPAPPAQPEDDTLLRKAFRVIGIATAPPRPQDFVVETRPKTAEDYISVGRKATEHPNKVKTAAELKAMDADLEATRVRHDAARAAFPPAAKAVADAERERRAKADAKSDAKNDAKDHKATAVQ
jgi:hypothetical protein